jgi:hypothetical protein
VCIDSCFLCIGYKSSWIHTKKKDNPNDKEIKPQNNFAKNIYPTVDIDAGCLSIITKIYREQIKL